MNKGGFDNKIKYLKNIKNDIMPKAHKEFIDITPIDTGHAKNNTKLRNGTIYADYDYAYVLDKGRHSTSKGARGSRQAPTGMIEPTIKEMESLVDKYIRKV
jgi:hypothetical protein